MEGLSKAVMHTHCLNRIHSIGPGQAGSMLSGAIAEEVNR